MSNTPQEKTIWKPILEVFADVELDETDLDLFCGEVGRFAEQRGGQLKVVLTPNPEFRAEMPSWIEVVGEK